MGNLMLWMIPFLLLLGSCGKNLPAELEKGLLPGGKGSPNHPQDGPSDQGPQKFLEGSFQTSEDKTVLLKKNTEKPLVLIFAQDTCLSCREESQMLVEHFKNKGGIPISIDLYTVLVGNILEDAQDFKHSLEIPWTVGFQNGDSLFRSQCPSLTVPCVIVQTPTDGLIFQKAGKFEIEELEKYTGSWRY